MRKRKTTMRPPFHYDDYGQIILDADNQLALEVRGWGMFQYADDGAKAMDDFGRKVVEAMNEKFKEAEL